MWNDKQTIITLTSTLIGFILGVVLLVWPPYKAAGATYSKIKALELRIQNTPMAVSAFQNLAQELEILSNKYDNELKIIPDNGKVTNLMEELSREIDGINILDLTFTTGSASALTSKEYGTIDAMPLKVEMISTFDEVFSLVQQTENMRHLVRISSLLIERSKEYEDIVSATIGLEAVYHEPSEAEGK